MIWSLVKREFATLTELETTWSLDDAERAVGILNMADFIEKKQQEKRP